MKSGFPEPIEGLVQWARRIAVGLTRSRRLFHYVDVAESAALEALSRALDRYDETRGPFRAYAVKSIVGATIDELGLEGRRLSVETACDVADADELDESGESAAAAPAPADALAAAIMDALAAAYVVEEIRLNGEAGLLKHEIVTQLHQHVERLPESDRRLVMLRYWDGLTWELVGEKLGLSDRTAREHDLRLRQQLKDALLADESRVPDREPPTHGCA